MRSVALALALLLATTGGTAFAQVAPHLQAKQGMVLIETSTGTGSGFAVSRDVVATACHVTKGAAAIQVHFWAAKTTAPGSQALCDERRDIAFLRTTVPDRVAILEFASSLPSQGEQIWLWGYPLGTTIASEPSISAGIVSATETARGFLALDVVAAPGHSGGAVVNAQGKVVGILVGGWSTAGQGGGFKYAAPSTAASALMTGTLEAAPQPGTSAQTLVPGAGIRRGDGIGPVRIGMTLQEVEQAIGLPASERDNEGLYIWEPRKLMVYFEDGHARSMGTWDTALSTADGLRVGAPERDVTGTLGEPACSEERTIRGRPYVTRHYDGLSVMLDVRLRRVVMLFVLPEGSAEMICG